MKLSVIIPTLNRSEYLKQAAESILNQTLPADNYEIIVVDNGSTDNTKEIVDAAIAVYPNHNILYFYEPLPGLHVGRHLGAKEARGDILVFVDDDIIATPEWLKSIKNAFNNPKVGLVGGRIFPKWESDVPDWINLFKSETEYGWTIGYLSLLDFGDVLKEIPAYYVYGCNFSIRKSVLYECGGFHPDSMPQELIRYRGDGETALSLAVMQKGYKSIYEPKAAVYHRVPPERLTIDYFCHRAFNQGVSDSYTEVRRKHGLDNVFPRNSEKASLLLSRLKKLSKLFMYWKTKIVPERHPVKKQIIRAYERGKSYHRKQVAKDHKLLEYILKENYF